MLKKLFYASASILMLTLAYHFGATTATAQAPSNPVVAMIPGGGSLGNFTLVTAGGDIYAGQEVNSMRFVANVFAGSTPVAQPTFGQVKAQYRK